MLGLEKLLKWKGYKAFAMQQLNNGHRVVEVHVNGRKGRFIVDTGATHNCISKDDCSFFKVLMYGDIQAEGVVSNELSKRSFNNSVTFGGKRVDDVHFIVLNMANINKSLKESEDEEVNGIIGMELLTKVNALFDCAGSKLYLKK